MRRLLKILFGLIILLILVAVAVPFLVPGDKIKEEVLARIEEQTGRDITIEHVTFSLFPAVALKAQGVRVSNPVWAQGGDMAQIKTLTVGLELMPLLHKEIRLREMTLEDPVILLIKQKGRVNWNFSKAGTHSAEPAPATTAASGNPARIPSDLHLAQITVQNGSITYRDDTTGKTETMAGANFTLKAPDLAEKADIKLTGTYQGQPLDIALVLDKPFAYEIGSLTEADLKLSYGALSFAWTGTFSLKPNGVYMLTGKVNIPSLEPAALSPKKDGRQAKAAVAPAPANASRWSDAPISLDALNKADADLNVTIGKLILPKATLEDIAANVKLTQGRLSLQMSEVKAYGGIVQAALAASSGNAFALSFTAMGVDGEKLLHDFAFFDRVSGQLNLHLTLTATGGSERAIISALNGKGDVDFKNGALKGINLASLLHRAGGEGANESTPFGELTGTFTVANGVISNNDLKMDSPLLRVTGAGTADLPNWQEHYLLKPMLVAKGDSGITVPVKVDGPLDHPHYQPDLQAALQENLKDPKKLKENLKNIRQNLLGNGGAGLKGLLGR